ncbi:PepSY domain-containing protein [Streptomyces sp. NPDC005409]|uniref:PepSY domain-containing protein n=1 Tax=Streptomyces sp. NPDC005409 TaxID=3155342 RepID=UPI0034532A93
MKRTAYISAAASVVLMVAGPVAAATAASADTARSVGATAAVRADVTAEAAAAAAVKKYPGVVESLDKDGDTWHVDVISKDGKEHAELEVAANGAVTERNRESEDSTENEELLEAKVTAQQAVKAALTSHPGAVESVGWDDDGGAKYWEVEVKGADGKTWNGHVDPGTGKVTESTDSGDSDDDYGPIPNPAGV